mgnify:CR=1 FL=1|tara:strand:+ start:55 stop:423 length:369 start_codon:yes stop_codon:yes gene_type:complete
MAAPNIVNVSSIYGKTMGAALGNTPGNDILSGASDKLLKINSIIIANVDGSSAADVHVRFYDYNVSTAYHLAKAVTVPSKSTLVVLGKDAPIYLEENDRIQAHASATGDLEIVISYEELDDA